MRLDQRELDDYVADLAQQAERYGIVLELAEGEPVALDVAADGSRRFSLVGHLPDGRDRSASRIEARETWQPAAADRYERSSYRYELVDQGRGYRRGFHRHDEAAFERRFGVVVHEHCESPIGQSPCRHLFGAPVRDGYRALDLLMRTWVGDPTDCASLPCLEAI